jgi:hypothetical protein
MREKELGLRKFHALNTEQQRIVILVHRLANLRFLSLAPD